MQNLDLGLDQSEYELMQEYADLKVQHGQVGECPLLLAASVLLSREVYCRTGRLSVNLSRANCEAA